MSEAETEELIQEAEPQAEVPAAVDPPKPEWTDEDAAEAKAFGWKSPDEWAGEKPEGYIDDPRRYMDRANNFRPFKMQRERLEKIEADYAERFRRIEAVTAKTIEREKAQYERDLAAIKAAQREAVENADGARFDALEAQKASLSPPADFPPPPKPEVQDDVRTEVSRYVAEGNAWVNNPILAEAGRVAIERGGYIGRPIREQLEYAAQKVREAYPAAFAPPAAEPPRAPVVQRVDGGGLGGGGKAGAFASLPAEAKSAFARFAKEGYFPDTAAGREAYANDYHS